MKAQLILERAAMTINETMSQAMREQLKDNVEPAEPVSVVGEPMTVEELMQLLASFRELPNPLIK